MLFWAFLFLGFTVDSKFGVTAQCSNSEMCKLDKKYVFIDKETPCFFSCIHDSTDNTSRKLSVELLTTSEDVFLYIFVQQKDSISSWALPRRFPSQRDNSTYNNMEQILCRPENQTQEFFFRIETNSHTEAEFAIAIESVPSIIQLKEKVQITTSPVSPWHTLFEWEENVASVFVSVRNVAELGRSVCSYLSIQDRVCPVGETEGDIWTSKGKYLSFQEKGTLVVKKSQFPRGFFIVIVTLPDDEICHGTYSASNETSRLKTTQIQVTKRLSILDAAGVFVVTSVIILIFTIVVVWIIYRCMPRYYLNENSSHETTISLHESDSPKDSSEEPDNHNEVPHTEENSRLPLITRDINPNFLKWWALRRKYQNEKPKSIETGFSNAIMIAALYVLLPFLEILRNYLNELLNKGWEDKCFFNAECAITFWRFSDFSAIYTNIAYVLLGFAFLFLVYRHKTLVESLSNANEVGINRNYGLLMSLGVGLIIQGVMSSFYHVCPNSVTFQFDMMFMYIICSTFIVSIWGFRHSRVQYHVYSSLGLVGTILVFAEMQNWVSPTTFWATFIVVQLTILTITSVNLYKFGNWSFTLTGIRSVWKEGKNIQESTPVGLQPQDTSKIWKLIVAVLLNVALMVMGAVINMKANQYVLYACLVNMSLYLVIYVIEKYRHGESPKCLSFVAFLLSLAAWIPALVFFKIRVNNSEGSPSSSRNLNTECILVGVFDSHDLWHMLSAYGLFFSFVTILTLDDDIAKRNIKDIPVF